MIVVHAHNLPMIGESRREDHRLGKAHVGAVGEHRSQVAVRRCSTAAPKHRPIVTLIRTRERTGRARTALLNAACSLAESYGERLRSCNVRDLNREKAEGMSPELAAALQPLFGAIALLTEASASTTRDRTAGRAELSRCVPAEAGQWSEKHPRSGYRF